MQKLSSILTAPQGLALATAALERADALQSRVGGLTGISALRARRDSALIATTAHTLRSASEQFADGSPELTMAHQALVEAMARSEDYGADAVKLSRIVKGESHTGLAPSRSATAFSFLQRFLGMTRLKLPIPVDIGLKHGFFGGHQIIITISNSVPDDYPLGLIFDQLYETYGLLIFNDTDTLQYDASARTLRRHVVISPASQDGTRPSASFPSHAWAVTRFSPEATTVTISVSDRQPDFREPLSQYLLVHDDYRTTERQFLSLLDRPVQCPLPDALVGLRRILPASDGASLAVQLERGSRLSGHDSLRYTHGRQIDCEVVAGRLPPEEILSFLGHNVLGVQWQNHGGSIAAELPGVRLVAYSLSNPVLSVAVEPTDLFSNERAVIFHDELLVRVAQWERSFWASPLELASRPLLEGPTSPANENNILVREEEAPPKNIFHLLLNGHVPALFAVSTANSVKDWKITLRLSFAHYNEASQAYLVRFFEKLIGTRFVVNNSEVYARGGARAPHARFLATLPGIGVLRMGFYSYHMMPVPYEQIKLTFEPDQGFKADAALRLWQEVLGKIRAFEKLESEHF